MAKKKAHYEVVFMPWADLHKEYEVGPFCIVPWKKMAVRNKAVKQFLDRYFERHIDHFGKAVDGIAVLVVDRSFAPVPRHVVGKARAAIDMFIFATIAPGVVAAVRSGQRNLAPPTADAYQLVLQKFDPSDDTIAVTVGGTTNAGRLGNMMIHKPWDVGGSCGFPDDGLLQGLGHLLKGRVKANVRKRLSRSLEWFRLAHVTGDGASLFTKAVMMSTAFEILFQIPDGPGKTSKFIDAVEAQVKRTDTVSDTRTITRGARTWTRTHSLPGWWADDFYDLRSRVVHGDPVEIERLRYKRWVSHLIVADVVFWQSMVEQLYSLRCFGADLRRMSREYDRMCPDKQPGWHEQELKDWLLGFDDVSRSLGWRPKKNGKK